MVPQPKQTNRRYILTLTKGNYECDLIWKKVFADIIKGPEIKSSWTILVYYASSDMQP